ncbi:MAG: hypothetical protein H6581_13535 [Bacteroidia bacterium]|nr:hypothetical protein [Bacteroidia bacterium]
MKSLQLPLTLLLLLTLAAACKPKTDKDPDKNPTGLSLEDQKANQAALADPASCANLKPDQYCIEGLQFIKLGDNLVWDSLHVDGATVKDTVFEEITNVDSFAWNVKIVRWKDGGKVILESDFNTYQLCGRIRIEKEGLVNQHGIGVGSTVEQLLGTYQTFAISPYPEMEVIELNPFGISNIYFHIPDPGNVLFNKKGKSISPEDLDPQAKISRIILWDNTVGNPDSSSPDA